MSEPYSISPYHSSDDPRAQTRPKEWSIDFQIELFFARIDGWHLEVAERCIDGWKINDRECINTTNRYGNVIHHIPDSGWAVLQITLNYFETIAAFRGGKSVHKKHDKDLLKFGVVDVFPELENDPAIDVIADTLFITLRGDLYHWGGTTKGKVRLVGDMQKPALSYDDSLVSVVINPHKFIPALRANLKLYTEELKDTNKVTLRNNFQYTFGKRYDQKLKKHR